LPDQTHANRLRRAAWVAAVVLGSAAALLVSCPGARAPGGKTELIVEHDLGLVPASYVGLHIHHAGAGTAWPKVPFASWRLWDAYVGWPWLEPTRGAWDWTIADRLVQLAGEHAVELVLPLGLSPAWASARPQEPSAYRPGFAAEPADLEDWRHYVEAVASRYAGRIHVYEIWNEPNLASFYSGDPAQMVRLCREAYAIIKRIDAAALVVSPSATGTGGVAWLDRFLDAGGGDCFDIVGFHLYVWPDPPEAIVPLVARVNDVMRGHGIAGRPLWNTETGWYIVPARSAPAGTPHPEALSESAAAATLARALVLARAAGVERFYWYAWDNDAMGLADRDGARAPGRALAEIQRWLVGAHLDGCRRGSDGTWICAVRRDGHDQWIVWNPSGKAELPTPPAWRLARRRDLSGTVSPLAAGARTMEIGPVPQLLESAGW
jgi:hypothetical protein